MGKTLSSSPAWVKASWISWKNSGSRDGATVATAWRSAGSDRAGMGINGSSPCGYSAVIQPASSHVQQQNNRATPRGGVWLFACAAVGWALPATLRTVAGREESGALLWTGSWTELSVQTVRSGPSAARLRGIRAGSAYDAPGHTSHNPPVVGSSPTRPTACDLLKHSEYRRWQAPAGPLSRTE